jgi:hypothetical protein
MKNVKRLESTRGLCGGIALVLMQKESLLVSCNLFYTRLSLSYILRDDS